MEDDWFNSENIDRTIEAQSQERRADPLQCLAGFLRDFWTDNTDEEARLVWQHRAAIAPRYAEDCLYCLERVIADPPADLEKFVREQGGLYLYHPDGTATLFTDEETLAWLKQIAEEFGAIYRATRSEDVTDEDE